MFYANLDDSMLDYPFIYDYDDYKTLREALDDIGEDLISAEWAIEENDEGKRLNNFLAWSEESVIILVHNSGWGDFLLKVKRNPG